MRATVEDRQLQAARQQHCEKKAVNVMGGNQSDNPRRADENFGQSLGFLRQRRKLLRDETRFAGAA